MEQGDKDVPNDAGKRKKQSFGHVGYQIEALVYALANQCELVPIESDVRHGFGLHAARAHRNAHIGAAQAAHVVDAVSDASYLIVETLQNLNHLNLDVEVGVHNDNAVFVIQ